MKIDLDCELQIAATSHIYPFRVNIKNIFSNAQTISKQHNVADCKLTISLFHVAA